MKTIPLEPVFKNPKFKELNPDIKFFVLNVVYKLCTEGKEGEPIPNSLRGYLECSETCYRNNKQVFRSVLESVMPQIAKLKKRFRNQTSYATEIYCDNASKRRFERLQGKLVEDIPENQAPLLPQHSAFATQLKKERIPNEHLFKNPIKPMPNRQPTLR
jgi:hypothetical protein